MSSRFSKRFCFNNCKVTGKKQTNKTKTKKKKILTSTMASMCTCTHTIASNKKGIKTRGPVQYKNKGVKALITSPDGLSSVPRTHVVKIEKISRKLSSTPCFLCYIHMHMHTHTCIHKINISVLLKGILTKKYMTQYSSKHDALDTERKKKLQMCCGDRGRRISRSRSYQ